MPLIVTMLLGFHDAEVITFVGVSYEIEVKKLPFVFGMSSWTCRESS